MTKILIDDIEVTEKEYLQRVTIIDDEEPIFCEEFLDLFDILDIDPPDELSFLDDFISKVSCAYLNFLDFYDTEYIEEYIC